MEARKEIERRVPHLKDFLVKSVRTLEFDQISQQMLRHKVSSLYGVARVLEMFENMLDTEKEELIAEVAMDLESAREKKKFFWNAIKTHRAEADRQLMLAGEENIETRRMLNRLQSNVESGKWKCVKVCEEANQRICQLQSEMNRLWPSLIGIRKELGGVNEMLGATKKDVVGTLRAFRKFNREARAQVLRRARKLSLPRQSNEDVKALADKLGVEREKTAERRRALDVMIEAVAAGKQPLAVDDIVESGALFKEALERAIEEAKWAGRPAPEQRDFRGQLQTMKAGMEQKLKGLLLKKESEYAARIVEQKERAEKLEQELAKAKARVKELMEAESCMEPGLIDQLESSHSEVQESQNRTDDMMNILFSQGTMTLSEPIDSLAVSPITKRDS